MGTTSRVKADHLYWLGRYIMRTYMELDAALVLRDQMLDGIEADYEGFCRKLSLENIYADARDWEERFFFDVSDPASIASCLSRAYDNAIVCREMITTVAMSYIQMALNAMEEAKKGVSPGIAFQWVIDDLLAFRGCVEERMQSEYGLDLLKTGFTVERLNLNLRLGHSAHRCLVTVKRLERYTSRAEILCDPVQLAFLKDTLTLAAEAKEQGHTGSYDDSRNALIAACDQLVPVV